MDPISFLMIVGTIARMEQLIQKVIVSLAASGLVESAVEVNKQYQEIADDIAGLAALRNGLAGRGLPGEDQVPGTPR